MPKFALVAVLSWFPTVASQSCDYATASPSPDNPAMSCETLELRNATMSVLLQHDVETELLIGYDVRTVVYRRSPFAIPNSDLQPARNFTAHRSIIACSVAIGWASDDCGSNVTCISGRVAAAAPFFSRAGERGCDIALLVAPSPFSPAVPSGPPR
jgi:hypothetical protein